jgi:hypothetical protein
MRAAGRLWRQVSDGRVLGRVSVGDRGPAALRRRATRVIMQDRHGAQGEQVVLNGHPMLRVTDRYGYHAGYYLTVEQQAQVLGVASLVEVQP